MRKLVFIILLLFVIAACTGGRHEQMLQQLSELERQNVADSVMTNDSLAEALVDYFDRHGSANERLRAHYILGRTYADMGEAPAAINAYLDAADCADTTDANCDFAKLSRVYGQMADVFYWQNLMDDYIDACDHSIYCAWKARDTIQAVNQMALKIAAYEQLDMPSKVIDLSNALFSEFGNNQNVGMVLARTSLVPLRHLLEDGYIEQAKRYLLLYETASGFFETNGQIISGMEVYYYYKGLYYSYVEQFDSAEYFYRKELLEGKDFLNQNMASYGLANLYSQINMPDSSAKYALYSYAMSDSVNRNQAMEEVENAKALYNYSRHQGLANKEHQIALKEKQHKEGLFGIVLILLLSLYGLFYFWQHKKRMLADLYNKKKQELNFLSAKLEHLQLQKKTYENQIKEKEFTIDSQKSEIEVLKKHEEEFKELIDIKEKTIIQKGTELEELINQKSQLLKQIEESEMAERQLQNEILLQRHGLDKRHAEAQIQESPIYIRIVKERMLTKLSANDWAEIENLFESSLPAFYSFISVKKRLLSDAEYRLCLLLRLHVGIKEASFLIGISMPSVSKACSKAMSKIFNEDGSGKELKKRLDNI